MGGDRYLTIVGAVSSLLCDRTFIERIFTQIPSLLAAPHSSFGKSDRIHMSALKAGQL